MPNESKKISKELAAAMKRLVPRSMLRRQIEMSRPLPKGGNTYEKLVAALPRMIVQEHLRGGDYLTVCDLTAGYELGFKYPGWRQEWFAKEVHPSWLHHYGKQIWEYCVENDLRPRLSPIKTVLVSGDFGTRSENRTSLVITWQRVHLDRLLGLDGSSQEPGNSEPVQAGELSVDQLRALTESALEAQRTAAELSELEFQAQMDEAAIEAAEPLFREIAGKLSAAAADGKYEAVVYQANAKIPGFSRREDKNDQRANRIASGDHTIFSRSDCWEAVVARGICIWAQSQKLNVIIRIEDMNLGQLCEHLALTLSWSSKPRSA